MSQFPNVLKIPTNETSNLVCIKNKKTTNPIVELNILNSDY